MKMIRFLSPDRSRDASYVGKILEGFTLAQKPPEDKTVSSFRCLSHVSAAVRTLAHTCASLQVFPPPSLPRDYRPVHRFRPSVSVSHLSGVSPALAEALRVSKGHMVKEEPQQGGRHQLESSQRRALLGEDALQGKERLKVKCQKLQSRTWRNYRY